MQKILILANKDDSEILDVVEVSEDEDVCYKKIKKLTPKQQLMINNRNLLKKSCSNFVQMFYVNSTLLFNDKNISRANISRLIYLATYIDYNDRNSNLLVKYGRHKKMRALTRNEIKVLLKLSKSTFEAFLKEMKDNRLIIEASNQFFINEKYFSKGKRRDDDNYTRVFIKTTRFIYENCSTRQHKTLSYIYQLIPYMNYELNILCKNPLEKDFDRIKKLTCKEICKLLSISTNNKTMFSFRESLKNFYINVNGKKYYLISYVKVTNSYGIKDYFVINPLCFWRGNNLTESKKVLSSLFFE